MHAVLDQIRPPVIVKAGRKPIDRSVSFSNSAPASELTRPPSKLATTLRPQPHRIQTSLCYTLRASGSP